MPRFFKSNLLERCVEKFVLSRADLVAGANEDNLQFARDSGANPARCTLFRYGNLIDTVHFENPSLRPVSCEDFITRPFLLCIARLELVKKVDDVLRVLAAVRDKGLNITAVLVGEGRERKSLESLASQLGVLDHVVFCGNKDQRWLASVIPHAAVVLSPHTGRALTEVALGAAPIAAYDVDWQGELIQTGVTGELAPFDDWQALSVSTIKLLQDPAYAFRVGFNVREKVLEMMDPEKLNEHERKQYIQLLTKQVQH
jgi:glycosyltransferase involved in cell wall biosynthesis